MGELVKTILYPVMTEDGHAELVLHLLSSFQFLGHLPALLTVTCGLLRFTFIKVSETLLETARPH